MKKLFILHDYSNNMKSKIDTFILKGKTNIWGEDVSMSEALEKRS